MPLGIGARIGFVLALCVADKVFLNQFVAFDMAQSAQGFEALVRDAQHWGFRFLAALAAALVIFAYVRADQPFKDAAAKFRTAPIRWPWMVLHLALIGILTPLTYMLFRGTKGPISIEWVVALWMAAASGAVLAAALTFAPASRWIDMVRSLKVVWLYALIAAVIGTAAMQFSQLLWAPTAGVTFRAVAYVLRGWIPDLQIDPASRLLSADRFAVIVADECSGLEGVGLILAFLVCWLTYFRREYYFPQALLLIPLGLAVMFALNILRIAALMLIGNAGHPEVAIYGFHSQAGWMAFIVVACGIAYFSRSSSWLSRQDARAEQADHVQVNATAVYLLPLLTLLAAGLVSHALSGKFEIFYPLRVVACLLVLWLLRPHLRALDWRCSWRAPLVGVGVFLLWWAFAQWLLPTTPMPAELADMAPVGRALWIADRLLGAIAITPLAEELAYRGYLMRRLQGEDFERISYAEVRWLSLAASAVVFGAMHAQMWPAAAAAGLAYGLLAKFRASLGEAVIAHATTNLLVGVGAIGFSSWQLW